MTKLAFDMSSYLKTALLTGTDTKDGISVFFNDKNVIVNSAEYGYEIIINMMTKTLRDCGVQPIDCVLVFEGMNSKARRLLISKDYKSKRDERPPEFYEEFGNLRDFIEKLWLSLGAQSVAMNSMEADDTLAWLARETEEDLIIASRDADLGFLNTEAGETNAYGATVRTYNDGNLGMVIFKGEPFVHPFRYVHLYKALVGDTSDTIPGAKGFGPKSFQKLAEKYGYDGLDELNALCAAGDLGPLHAMIEEKEHSSLKVIVAHEADVIRSWKLAKLYPEWVHTLSMPFRLNAGKVAPLPDDADERLAEFYGLNYLVGATDYDEACQMLREELQHTEEISFDIETSTPEESDDWLAAQGNPDGVDQIASYLVGFSLTFGRNMQHTMYVTVAHADSDNITMSQARKLLEICWDTGKPIIIQNTMFELGVLHMAQDEDGASWASEWERYGAKGFVPNVLDTKIEANYTNENISTGLKFRSKHHLDYAQQTYNETCTLTGLPADLPKGGRLLHEDGEQQTRRYKMHELTADQVFSYGADDPICTFALHNHYRWMMQLEHQYDVYKMVELDAAYLHAQSYNEGFSFSLEAAKEQEKHDDEVYDRAWAVLRTYLISKGWAGTVPPVYGADITAAQIKDAYRIVTQSSSSGPDLSGLDGGDGDGDGEEESEATEAAEKEDEDEEGGVDEFLKTRVRTPAKLVILARSLGHEVFAEMLERCLAGEHEKFTSWVQSHFTGEPVFKASNNQMCHLMYEVMGLPIVVRNKPTEKMRKEGKPGGAKGDNLAIEYALRSATPEVQEVLKSLKLMQMVKTRRGLYYDKYPNFVHWRTGKIHGGHNQSHTNTRRASEMKPNKQQLPKHPKIAGEPARFRETIQPHKPNAVVVSMDFNSQELRVIAEQSQDPAMLSCFVGDDLKDMHSLLALSIIHSRDRSKSDWSYEAYRGYLDAPESEHYDYAKEMRALGKKVGFTTEYGAMAPKLAMTLLCSEAEAQVYINAKEKLYHVASKWKKSVIEEAKRFGFVRSMCGAVRHLADIFRDGEFWQKSKAERQAVNFKIQSSSAEMTKLSEGRAWQKGIFDRYDAVYYGPVHDELLASVVVDENFVNFLKEMHWCMVQKYADMTVPIVSSISFGPNFGQQIEIGEDPNAEAIGKGLRTLAEKHPQYAFALKYAA